jgi:hypothetical protein
MKKANAEQVGLVKPGPSVIAPAGLCILDVTQMRTEQKAGSSALS